MHFKIRSYTSKNELNLFDTIGIETSEFCNRTCSFCPNSIYSQNRNLMLKELFENLIYQLKDLNYSGVICFHQYNEPLLDLRLDNLIEFTRINLRDSTLMISSNGDALTHKRWINLRKKGLDFAVISQYDEEINPTIASLIDKLSSQENEALIIKIRGAFNLTGTRGGNVNVNHIPETPLNEPCLRPFSQLVIRYNGMAVLCCEDYIGEAIIGDTRKDKLIEIWQSEKLNEIRIDLLLGNRKGICAKCNTTYKSSVESCDWIGESRKFLLTRNNYQL